MGESMRHSFILLAAASAPALILSGCARNEAAEPKAAPLPQVSVAPVISRKVTEFDELTGRFERSEEHTSELQSQSNLVCRLLLEKKKKKNNKLVRAKTHTVT